MQEGKTIGQLMEEMRQKAGAQNYHGHDYMDLQRFAENTRHMIIFDVLTDDSPVGWKGERTRLFLSEIGYEKALDSQASIRRLSCLINPVCFPMGGLPVILCRRAFTATTCAVLTMTPAIRFMWRTKLV